MTPALDLRAFVRDIPDYPKPGILFRDLTPLFGDPKALAAAIEALAAPFRGAGIGHVLGIESRGFVLGAPVALQLGAGFVPVRKAGKLPHHTVAEHYDLEYGTDCVEMHADAVEPGARVLLVDDLLATGGTARATIRLARKLSAELVACSFLVELMPLRGREHLELEPEQIHAVLSL